MISGKGNSVGILLRLQSMIVVGGKAVCLTGENVFLLYVYSLIRHKLQSQVTPNRAWIFCSSDWQNALESQ